MFCRFHVFFCFALTLMPKIRNVSRIPATYKMKLFVTLVNGFQPLNNVTKNSMLDVAGVLETPLIVVHIKSIYLPVFHNLYRSNFDILQYDKL